MDEWRINKDRSRCDKPGCPLATERQYVAVLELPACTRKDMCAACFTDYERRSAEPPIFWRALRKRSGSKEPVLDLMSLRVLFDRLGGVEDERVRGLRYFCALLLLRKRMLKMVRPRNAEEERADLVVVDPKLKEMEPVALFAPAIDLENLGGIKDELLAMMGEDKDGESQA